MPELKTHEVEKLVRRASEVRDQAYAPTVTFMWAQRC